MGSEGRGRESQMTVSDMRILIVADDDARIGAITHHITMELTADVTVVGGVGEARLILQETEFDVIVAEQELPDGSALALLQALGAVRTPVIFLDDEAGQDWIIRAFRAGAADVLTEPVDGPQLVARIQEAVRDARRRRRQRIRHRRLRRVSSRMMKDRREMRQRVDLICRDLVGAYRRLAEKVVARTEETAQNQP